MESKKAAGAESAPGNPILLSLEPAATRAGVTTKQLKKAVETLDIRFLELDGVLYFTEAALWDWVKRHERRVW